MSISDMSQNFKLRPNRTFICSVIFLDIAEYSKKSVEEQITLKTRFNTLIAETLTDIPVNDRIILDTGDGAAIGFLGDPEDALFVAMNIRDALNNEQATAMPDLNVRMGINLGPVKLIKDINNQLNLIGDGINIAQRIMSFAENGQLLVSRSYYDIVSCLSQEYAQLFQFKGVKADKHIRDHYLYSVGHTDALSIRGHHKSEEEASAAIVENEAPKETSLKNITNNDKTANNKPEKIRTDKKIIFVAVPVIAVIVIAIFLFTHMGKDKLSFMKKPAQTSSADTESKQVAMKPSVRSFNADGIVFIYNSIQLTDGKVTLSIRIRNNTSVEQSVALYDKNFTWSKSKLISHTGKPFEVTEVNFTKDTKKITSKEAGTKGVPIKPHQTIKASLIFDKTGKDIKLINIHPFIYQDRRHWKEHDLPLIFS